MNEDLKRSLADNAKQWLALSLSISSAETQAFTVLHEGFLTMYGAEFMTRVYRATLQEALQHMPEVERNKLLVAFQQAFDKELESAV